MKEVSCRAFNIFLRPLEQLGVSVESLVEGTQVSADLVRNERGWVTWNEYVTVMRRLRTVWPDDEALHRFGQNFARGGGGEFRWGAALLRLLFSIEDFYRWIGTDPASAANTIFPCITPSYRRISDRSAEITLRLATGHEPCPEFFLITQGMLAESPRLLGLPPADVKLDLDARGGRFLVQYQPAGGRLAILRRVVTWPLEARVAATELKRAHVDLLERFEELQVAQERLNLQTKQLEAAMAISQLIHRDLDLERTVEAISNALIEVGGYQAVRIEIEVPGMVVSVAPPPNVELLHGEPLERRLEGRNRPLGKLSVWVKASDDRDQAVALLARLLPGIAMALEVSASFTEVQNYRNNLERMVSERTEELVNARDELQTTVRDLELAQAARDRIFANINHEIRTPLSLITLAIRSLERQIGPQPDPAVSRDLSSIDFSSRRLIRMVDGLLLLAAREEGKLTLKAERVDLSSLLRATVGSWQPAAQMHQVDLVLDTADEAVASVDRTAIEQVVTNLVSNALKFTPPNGTIDVKLFPEREGFAIHVRDTGCGMKAEFLSRIFGRFEQGTAPVQGSSRGSGIGLAIVHELTELHGGTVRVESEEGNGSVFKVWLPKGAEGAASNPVVKDGFHVGPEAFGAERGTRPVLISRPENAKGTLLIAEDDPDLLDSLIDLLRADYGVIAAPNGEAALELARQHQPDMLITDLDMPKMDGVELTRAFRSLSGNRLAPVLILSSHTELDRRLEGFEAGAVDYVSKPFQPSELMARVRSQLSLRDLALKLHESAKLSAMGGLVAGVAHEIRNPANGIVNALPPLRRALLKASVTGNRSVDQLLQVIENCSNEIAVLSRNLLDLHGQRDLLLSPVDVPSLVDRARRLCEAPLEGLTFEARLSYDGMVRCSAALIIQILGNLIENGAHSAGSGGWVNVESREDRGQLVLEVSDSGPGVPLQLRERIFDPFFTTKSPGKGTGLGLTTSRTIAERHGGSLRVVDGPRGACFQLCLPLVTREASADLGRLA